MVPEGNQPVEIADQVLDQLAASGKLMAILDTCDAADLYAQVQCMDAAHALCLFRDPDEDLAKVAPYLVRVDRELLGWLREGCWEEPWGIFFLLADVKGSLGRCRKHLRRFLVVKSPEGEALYFRYYDPRVASVFLRSCSDDELKDFLGPFKAVGLVDRGRLSFFFLPE